MQTVDAHQHFWRYDPVRDSWITDSMAVIQGDFMPEDLQPILEDNGIDACVVVQSAQSEAENSFQLDIASRHSFIKGIVGWVDLQSAQLEERLAYYAQFPKMKGFRHILQGEADRAFMLRPDFKRGISKLRQFAYTYDILIFPDQLTYTKEFISAFPDQPFVINHLAKPNIREQDIKAWRKDIKAVAAHENVFCKISGMVTEAGWKQWENQDFTPYLDVVVEAFGTNRIMYGSDWPVCSLAASYQQVIGLVKEYFSFFSPHEQALFFGGNASAFYRLGA